jgi:dTMP kinase
MLVTFEGIDGAGKTTVSRRLFELLREELPGAGYYARSSADFPDPDVQRKMVKLAEVIWTRDVGRRAENPFTDEYWLFLLAAWFSVLDRQLLTVRRQEGWLTIFESWYYRLIAKFLQKGFDRDWMLSLFATVEEPDLVVLLDIPPQLAWHRRPAFSTYEVGAWDSPAVDDPHVSFCCYQEKVRAQLLRFARERSWLVIRQDERSSVDEVCARIADEVLRRASRPPGAPVRRLESV